ncbi:MAG TPA: FAD-dependent oxidoreductase [Burkholderiales bacterium]|nr:FAD-dependent oxidoreductase [Burkholderiales bacterium]
MFDIAIVGGGLVGSSIAWGLAKIGQRVVVLDEGDIALRASRGNFALIWVQSKGLGMPAYSRWTHRSALSWPRLADELARQTGVDVALSQPGGFHIALGPDEFRRRAIFAANLMAQAEMPPITIEMVERARLREALPEIGPDVAGASFCAADGHCNALRLFRALHQGMQMLGVVYRPNEGVRQIERGNGWVRITTAVGEVHAGKVVLAAGIANARLGPMVGLEVPVAAQRGQIIVTEKTTPFLHYPTSTVRQTDEGGLLLGDSREDGQSLAVDTSISAVLADRAVRMFPKMATLNVVRTWAALRVMTPDGFPIYEQSTSVPEAFVATCHSGVTLAANHALVLPTFIAQGVLPAATFDSFSTRRFRVPAVA